MKDRFIKFLTARYRNFRREFSMYIKYMKAKPRIMANVLRDEREDHILEQASRIREDRKSLFSPTTDRRLEQYGIK
jgi:hypothetical protein